MESKKKTVRGIYLVHALEGASLSGHTYVTEDELFGMCRHSYCRISRNTFRNDLAEQIRLGNIQWEGRRLYLTRLLRYENAVAFKLSRLLTANSLSAPVLPETIEVGSITLNPEQREAVQMALGHRLSIILGGAGCGKTTLIEALVQNCPQVDPLASDTFVLCAPTGKAACNLSAKTGLPARTVHSSLRKVPDSDFLELGAVEWGSVRLVVIDEASMLSLEHLAGVLRAANTNCRIVLVGDPNQLLPVGPGNILPDLLELGFPKALLRICHRQANAETALAYNVREFRSCRSIEDLHYDDSFVFLPVSSEEEIQARICTEAAGFYKAGSNAQVLALYNAGTLSVSALNPDLRDKLIPEKKPESRTGYRERDRVMILKNDWVRHVCNGDIGTFHSISGGEEPAFRVVCDGGLRQASWCGKDYLNLLCLAYAITVHKSQGSEYDVVIMPVTSGFSFLMNRNMIYTAISRARQRVILVGNPKALDLALKRDTPERHSMLLRKVHMYQHSEGKKSTVA